jgi:hypothetical protein
MSEADRKGTEKINGGKREKERKSSIHDLILARLIQSVWQTDKGEAIEESGFISKVDQEICFPLKMFRQTLIKSL